MIKVELEIRQGADPFRVTVEAGGITQAVGIAEGRHPDGDVRVVFPIDAEEFFVGDDGRRTEAGRKRPPVAAFSRARDGDPTENSCGAFDHQDEG